MSRLLVLQSNRWLLPLSGMILVAFTQLSCGGGNSSSSPVVPLPPISPSSPPSTPTDTPAPPTFTLSVPQSVVRNQPVTISLSTTAPAGLAVIRILFTGPGFTFDEAVPPGFFGCVPVPATCEVNQSIAANLSPGVYNYTVTIEDRLGRTATQSGTVEVTP